MHHQPPCQLPCCHMVDNLHPPPSPLTSKHLFVMHSLIHCNKTALPAVTPPSSGTFLRKQTTRRHTTETVRADRNTPHYSLPHKVFSKSILSLRHFRSSVSWGFTQRWLVLPTFRNTIKQSKKKIILDPCKWDLQDVLERQ